MPITWSIEVIYMVYRGDADYLAYRTDLYGVSG